LPKNQGVKKFLNKICSSQNLVVDLQTIKQLLITIMITENGHFGKHEAFMVYEAFASQGYSEKEAANLMIEVGLEPYTSAERVLIKYTANFHVDNGDTIVLASVKAMIKIAKKRKLVNTLTFKH
jgi:hypothetical protein